MPPRRKQCILSSPEDSDQDDVVSAQTTTQFNLQHMSLNSTTKTQPNKQSQRNRTSVEPIPLNISSSDDDEPDFPNPPNNNSNVGVNVNVFRHEGSVIRDSQNRNSNVVRDESGVIRDSQNSTTNGLADVNVVRDEGSVIRDFQDPNSDGGVYGNVVRFERSGIRDSQYPNRNGGVDVSVFRQEGSVVRDFLNPASIGGVSVNVFSHEGSIIRDSQSPNSNVNIFRHEGSVIRDSQNPNNNGGVDVNVVREERGGIRDSQNPNSSGGVNVNVNRYRGSEIMDSQNPNSDAGVDFNVVQDERSQIGGGVGLVLRNMGLNLRREWFESCMNGLLGGVGGFESFNDCRKAKMCFEQFLKADMNFCGGGVLPENVNSLHLVELKGPFIMQVDEIVNISCPLRSRYQKAAPGLKRCLKLSMTDGIQRVFGMEYRPIGALDVFAPAGLKVAISNVCVRHGLLMLVPEVFAVLGGLVEELEAARERLVQEVNKPPRGKRTRIEAIPPLASRATLAAWPQGNANAPVQTNDSRVDSSVHFQTAEQGAALHTPAFRAPAIDRAREHSALRSHQEARTTSFSASALDGVAFHATTSHAPASDRTRKHTTLQSHQETGTTSFSASSSNGAALHTPTHRITEDITPSSRRHNMETNYSAEDMDVEEINMADGLEFPYILNGEKEIPFTYLASLSTKWATTKGKARHVQGMIKGALIGVKQFRYKETDKYELRLHVDDGSLISEIHIDHSLVERLIGHPPQVVAAGIVSPDGDLVIHMKKKLTQFQQFLANFEGMMFVQFNEAYSLPLVMEMNEGCSVSDAWKLLRRLQPSTSTGQPQHGQFNPVDPIELSP